MASSSSSTNGILGGFLPSWYAKSIRYETGSDNIPPSDVRPPSSILTSYYTHVFYAFLNPNPNNFYKLHITSNDEDLMRKFTHHLHSANSSVKAFLAIGGSTREGQTNRDFSAMAGSKTNRGYFIQSIIQVSREYGFDGVNLGWEYPQGEKGMKNLVSLLTELRQAVDKEARETGKTKIGISVAVYFAADLSLMSSQCVQYPAKAIAANVDFLNVMCYDYAGSWETSLTGSIAALNGWTYCTRYGIKSWIDAGVPPEKLVLGIPLYGRTWKLEDPNINGIGAPAVGTGPQDDVHTKGCMLYRKVVTFNETHNATEVYDEGTVSYYSYAGTNWISYDGEKSVEAKVKYAKKEGLGGYFFWAIGSDHQDNRLTKTAWTAWTS